MNYKHQAALFVSGATLICGLFFATPAQAESGPTIAAEVGANVVLSDLTDDETLSAYGPALSLRLGYSFKAPMIRFTPEAKISFESPGTPNAAAIMGGARLNLLEGLSPAVFAHAGGMLGDLDGFVWDFGLGLDVTLIPLIDIGIYGAYYRVGNANIQFGNEDWSSRESYEWVQFGAQLAFHF